MKNSVVHQFSLCGSFLQPSCPYPRKADSQANIKKVFPSWLIRDFYSACVFIHNVCWNYKLHIPLPVHLRYGKLDPQATKLDVVNITNHVKNNSVESYNKMDLTFEPLRDVSVFMF